MTQRRSITWIENVCFPDWEDTGLKRSAKRSPLAGLAVPPVNHELVLNVKGRTKAQKRI